MGCSSRFGLGDNGRLPSSVRISWLLTHTAHSFGLGSGCRVPGEDPSSPYPRQYAGASQGSPLEAQPGKGGAMRGVGKLPPLCPPSPVPQTSPPAPGPLPSLARPMGLSFPHPSAACHSSPTTPRPRPARPPLPLLSGGYSEGLGSAGERRLHPCDLRSQLGSGLQEDPTTLPPASSLPLPRLRVV